MTPLEEWARLLHELGLGVYSTGVGGNVFHPTMPAAPDLAVAVATYSGGPQDSRNDHDSVRVQFRVRGPKSDSRIGEQLAQDIYDQLIGLTSRTLPGGTWLSLLWCPQGGPAFIGQDAVGRPEWVVNFAAELMRSTPNRT